MTVHHVNLNSQEMTLSDYNELASTIQAIFTSLSIVIGGSWVFYRFVLQQERYPNINFTTDINIIGEQGAYWIVELTATIDNKGKAQHKMSKIGFDLNALFDDDPVLSDEKWGGQIDFPHRLIWGSYLPKHQAYFFVDPGTQAKYSFLTKVPLNSSYLILHSNFIYSNRKNKMHTAEKTIKVEPEL